jgi:3-hydroxyacyl-CoA dehydrogenase
MDILALLKEGRTVEDISEDFFDELQDAQVEYEAWKKEQEERAKAEAARKVEEEFLKQKKADARAAVGAAIVNYFETLGMVMTEKDLKDIDLIVEALPNLKVVRTFANARGWF